MNLYTFHNKPEILDNYDEYHSDPERIWSGYHWSDDRMKKFSQAFTHDPAAALAYAQYIEKGRFEEGEDMIATNAEHAYDYAINTIGGRFEKGEEAMKTKSITWGRYTNFLNSRGIDI